MIVVLVAVRAGEVAAPDGDDVGQDGVPGGEQAFGDHPQFAEAAVHSLEPAGHQMKFLLEHKPCGLFKIPGLSGD